MTTGDGGRTPDEPCWRPKGWSQAAVDGDPDAIVAESRADDERKARASAAGTACAMPGAAHHACQCSYTSQTVREAMAIAALRVAEEGRRVIARLDHAGPRGRVELCRDDLPPEQAGRLIALLGASPERLVRADDS
jgi:hypothetical protein